MLHPGMDVLYAQLWGLRGYLSFPMICLDMLAMMEGVEAVVDKYQCVYAVHRRLAQSER